MKELKDYTVTELKALAFDLQNDIQAVIQMINKRLGEPKTKEDTGEPVKEKK